MLLKENGRLDGICTRIPRLERPGSSTLRRQGGNLRERLRLVAIGHAAQNICAGITLPAAVRATANGDANKFRKEHTPSSLSVDWRLRDWTAAGLLCGRWLIALGSAVKPLMESGKNE